MKKEGLINVINTTITNKLGLIISLLGILVFISTTIMIIADKMSTYISGTITLIGYLFLIIRYILKKNSKCS